MGYPIAMSNIPKVVLGSYYGQGSSLKATFVFDSYTGATDIYPSLAWSQRFFILGY